MLKAHGQNARASTAVEVLEELAAAARVCRASCSTGASCQKLKGTYIDALPHAGATRKPAACTRQFNQAVAATGRLSSSDPNLQNIPIRTELGREIRARVHRRSGSRADLRRLLADRAARARAPVRRQTLIAAFTRGDDIHDQTALKVFGPDSALDPHELRRRAKIINYALLYGKTAFTLAKDIGVTQQAAQEFIDAYFAGFPRVRAFIDETLGRCPQRRRRQDDVRTAAAGAGAHQPQRPDSRRAPSAIDGQHADPGHRRRHPEARDDRRCTTELSRRQQASEQARDDPHRARRAGVREVKREAAD